MAYKTGSDTSAGIVQGSTYGTAVEVATGDKLILESINNTRSVTIGESNGIGSGLSMDKNADTLNTEHSVSITQQARYDDGGLPLILAAFFGASTGTPAENNVGEGDYLHVITWLATSDKFLTVAQEATTTETFEWPSCYVNSISINSNQPPAYLEYTADMVANTKVIDSAVNTNATLAAATELGETIVVHDTTDYVWLNAQAGGALSVSDQIDCVTSVTIDYARTKRISNCFGGSQVLVDDKFIASITMNFDTLENLTHFTSHHNGTEHKGLFRIQGAQIGAGDNASYTFYFPRLKVVESPDYSVSEAGANGYSVQFKSLVASANPTGMTSTYPYVEIVNENSAAILA